MIPAFDLVVTPDGYAWWYIDAVSDDGQHGITVIAFLGSVFSPYYAHARKRAGTQDPPQGSDPLNHCAINVALYSPGRQIGGSSRWAMTERGRHQVWRVAGSLRIGPSAMRWRDGTLIIDIDEVAVPLPLRIRGRITLVPMRVYDHEVELSTAGRHLWCPGVPKARVSVQLDAPALQWSGTGYMDSNRGDGPLEQVFGRWDWSRTHLPGGRSMVFYDTEPLNGPPRRIGLLFRPDGRVTDIEGPPGAALPRSMWQVPRGTRSDAGMPATVVRTLTDAPFYARSLVRATWLGEPVVAMHESLSLQRFSKPWVRAMLPFRMPRKTVKP